MIEVPKALAEFIASTNAPGIMYGVVRDTVINASWYFVQLGTDIAEFRRNLQRFEEQKAAERKHPSVRL